jgi:hypothetical protein
MLRHMLLPIISDALVLGPGLNGQLTIINCHGLPLCFLILSGTSKTGCPIFITKPLIETNITAHGPSRPAQALLHSKSKPKDKCPSPQRSSASSDPSLSRSTPVTSSRRPSPMTSSRRSTLLHSYCFARPPLL